MMTEIIKEIAASVISRCRLSDIEITLMRWGHFKEHEVQWLLEKRPTKAQIARKFNTLIKKKDLNQEIIGDLELAYIQLHPRCKQWKVFQMKGKNLKLGLDPRSLCSRLTNHTQLAWMDGTVEGNMSLYAGMVWLRLHLGTQRAPSKSKASSTTSSQPRAYKTQQSVFVVVISHSPYVIVSSAGQKLMKTVCGALQHVLGADKLSLQLTGRHVASLADIVLQKHHNTLNTKFRDKECKENSLCPPVKRQHPDKDEIPSVEGVVDENKKEKRLRVAYLRENFGDGAQPELETVSFKFNTEFCGQKGLSCQSSIQLKGPSVLEGIREAARVGAIKCPLPKHLMAVTERGMNFMVLESKKKA